MRIAIVGPGAMGCLFAYLLSRDPSHEIWLVDILPERVETLRSAGLLVEGVSGTHHLRPLVSMDPAGIGLVDLVILTVKAPDTYAAALSALPLLGRETLVLTLQNGMGNIEEIDRAIGPGRTLGGTTSMGATVLAMNRIRHAGWGETIVGEPAGKTRTASRAEKILALFKGCGLEASFTKDLDGLLWSKLVINAGINPLTALTRLHNGQLLEHSGTRAVMEAAVKEAAKVAEAGNIRLLYGAPVEKVAGVCRATAGNVSSMLQDVLRELRTEINQITGVIVREGARLGVPVPVNESLLNLVRTVEESYSKRVAP